MSKVKGFLMVIIAGLIISSLAGCSEDSGKPKVRDSEKLLELVIDAYFKDHDKKDKIPFYSENDRITFENSLNQYFNGIDPVAKQKEGYEYEYDVFTSYFNPLNASTFVHEDGIECQCLLKLNQC